MPWTAAKGRFAGIAFQRAIERAAFEAGGGDSAPCQRRGFLERRRTAASGDVRPTYLPGAVPGDLRAVLPDFVCDSMGAGIREMGKRLRGFDAPDALSDCAGNARSSSPVRILRGENRECPAVRGLFPCGEGRAMPAASRAPRWTACAAPRNPAPEMQKKSVDRKKYMRENRYFIDICFCKW